MLKQRGFLFDADRCTGCKTCETACKNENKTPAGVNWRKVRQISDDYALSFSCNHCDSPECFRVCPEKAFKKRRDGIVTIQTGLCNGCMDCVQACPYDAPGFDPVTHKVSKCTLCLPRQLQGLEPACVQACPNGALRVHDFNEASPAGTVARIDGFPDIRLTRPSIRFYPVKLKRRYFIE